jgi:hypothetical protein
MVCFEIGHANEVAGRSLLKPLGGVRAKGQPVQLLHILLIQISLAMSVTGSNEASIVPTAKIVEIDHSLVHVSPIGQTGRSVGLCLIVCRMICANPKRGTGQV